MKIYAPVKSANGVYASVRFINGVGETDDPTLIDWFKNHGYTLEKCEDSTEEVVEKCDISKIEIEKVDDELMGYGDSTIPNLEEMTPNDIREWAKANGYGSIIRNTRNKEKLIELIRG